MIEQKINGLQCTYMPFDSWVKSVEHRQANILGTVCFTAQMDPAIGTAAPDLPLAHVAMPSLDESTHASSICEIWRVAGHVTSGKRGALSYSHNEELLFGVIQLSEDDFDIAGTPDGGKTPLQHASEFAYLRLFELIDEFKFPHVLRVWNYIADINGSSYGMERYRQFNMGRQDGFVGSSRSVMGSVPAASAVGFRDGPLTIYFLAGRGSAPLAIENPRQVSAYKYPEAYGPRSPTFSRASIADLGGKEVLFLSGTASIVGHKSLHAGDVAAQTCEAMVNITALVDEANRVSSKTRFKLTDLHYKVYVRHEKDVALIDEELQRILGSSVRVVFLLADICRADLAVEIEATAGYLQDFSL